jgi:hypothetical protein
MVSQALNMGFRAPQLGQVYGIPSPHMIYAAPSSRNGGQHGACEVRLVEQSYSTFDSGHLFPTAQTPGIIAPCHFQSASEDLAWAAMLPVMGRMLSSDGAQGK